MRVEGVVRDGWVALGPPVRADIVFALPAAIARLTKLASPATGKSVHSVDPVWRVNRSTACGECVSQHRGGGFSS